MKQKISILIIIIIIFVLGLVFLNIYINNSVNEQEVVSIPKVTSTNFDSEVLQSDKIVLVDFYADWCEPCKVFSPILEDVADDYDYVKVVKVNVDEEVELAQKYGIISLPTLLVVKNGKVVDRSTGALEKIYVLDMIREANK